MGTADQPSTPALLRQGILLRATYGVSPARPARAKQDGAVEKTRTSTGYPTATSTLRVYQFRHDRIVSEARGLANAPAFGKASGVRYGPAQVQRSRQPVLGGPTPGPELALAGFDAGPACQTGSGQG